MQRRANSKLPHFFTNAAESNLINGHGQIRRGNFNCDCSHGCGSGRAEKVVNLTVCLSGCEVEKKCVGVGAGCDGRVGVDLSERKMPGYVG
jgi:hypothetical protein